MSKKKVYICIALYHEYIFDDIEHDIEALFFVDSKQEALEYLNKYQTIVEDKKSLKKSIDIHILDFISGDYGNQIAQLCGNFVDITDKKNELIKIINVFTLRKILINLCFSLILLV